ncbi:MAG TPA: PIN domain-containing protein [Candidatus Baltobacteraceae bacterium]
MTLVDTSVWIDYFRRGNSKLEDLLEDDTVLTHPFVIGELACGALPDRRRILADLAVLPRTNVAHHDEVLHLVENRALWSQGVGWIDCHLLASAIISRCNLWTLDLALQRAAAAVIR